MGAPVRIGIVVGTAVGAVVLAAACGNDESQTRDTMPPINTTTSTTTTTTPPTTRPKTYEIKQGESLFGVAERFKLNWVDLAKFNKIKNPDDIQAGQVIRIPPVAPRSPRPPASPTTVR